MMKQEFIFPDPITSEAINWLQEKQPAFSQALSEFGKKIGIGFEGIRKPYLGQFTGAGLCAIAAGAQEAALVRKYGDELTTRTYFFYTVSKDPSTYANIGEACKAMGHWVVLFKAARSREPGYFADPTYRQFLIGTNPDRMLIGFPEVCIDDLYEVNKVYKELVAQDHRYGRKCKPKFWYNGKMDKANRDDIRKNRCGWLNNVTEADYMELIETFS